MVISAIPTGKGVRLLAKRSYAAAFASHRDYLPYIPSRICLSCLNMVGFVDNHREDGTTPPQKPGVWFQYQTVSSGREKQ